ncbi:MAG: WG repeat-containing protein, partial [Bacteroidetes bacterium]|nr:WG repeat-containing protein [Bacteroidota bacterium]
MTPGKLIVFLLFASFAALHAQDNTLKSENLKAGKVHPSAIRINVDMFGEFNDGLCSFKKGDQIGFINALGDTIIPLGKYQYFKDLYLLKEENMPRFQDGYCQVIKEMKDRYNNRIYRYGFINREGELAIDYKFKSIGHFADGFAYQLDSGNFFDKNGKKVNPFPVNKEDFIFPEGVEFRDFTRNIFLPLKLKKDKNPAEINPFFTYYDIFLEPGIEGNFTDARPFHDGMAAVAHRDDSTGITLWGFIDEAGTLVVPYQFDQRPENYACGLAAIHAPTTRSDDPRSKKMEFIDKEGKLAFSIYAPYDRYGQWTPLKFIDDHLMIWEANGFRSYGKTGDYVEGLKMLDQCGKGFYSIGRPLFPVKEVKGNHILVSRARSLCGQAGL